MDKTKLTKTVVDQLAYQDHQTAKGNHVIRWDSQLTGFGCRVFPSGEKTFVYRYRSNGKRRYITLGGYPDITVDQARNEAKRRAGEVAKGTDPQQQKQEAKQQARQDEIGKTTLAQAYAAYKDTRALSPKTLRDYERVMLVTLKDWQNKSLTKITAEMVATRHKSLSPAYGNLVMRVLRAVFNFAMEKYTLDDGTPVVLRNPTRVLSSTKAWKKVAPRTGHLKPHELGAWLNALEQEENHTIRDFLIFVLFTGLRKENAASLRWDQVDFPGRSFTVTPKMHETMALPLPDHLVTLLKVRRESATSPYVFPGEGKGGYLQEPKKALQRIEAKTGIKTTIHDLRRSYGKFGATIGLPLETIKRLMAHTAKGDVTIDHYIQHSLETLRKPADKIAGYILSTAHQQDNVVPFYATK